jgi:hypothetical protein
MCRPIPLEFHGDSRSSSGSQTHLTGPTFPKEHCARRAQQAEVPTVASAVQSRIFRRPDPRSPISSLGPTSLTRRRARCVPIRLVLSQSDANIRVNTGASGRTKDTVLQSNCQWTRCFVQPVRLAQHVRRARGRERTAQCALRHVSLQPRIGLIGAGSRVGPAPRPVTLTWQPSCLSIGRKVSGSTRVICWSRRAREVVIETKTTCCALVCKQTWNWGSISPRQ